MKRILKIKAVWPVLTVLCLSAGVSAEAAITCTATPDCGSLGYTKSAAQCPDGGVKCPFDANKMFCVAAGDVDFTFKNKIAVGHIVYSDGTTSTSYNANKLAIGVVYYVHPNGKQNHGLIVSLEQPVAQRRSEAIKRCAGFSTKGTRAGDWHLPDIGELALLSNGNNNMDEQITTFMGKIPGAHRLGYSYTYFYWSSNVSVDNYNSGKNYLDSRPVSPNNRVSAYSLYYSYYYWSRSDNFSSTSAWFYYNLGSNLGFQSASVSDKYGQFRCVAEF